MKCPKCDWPTTEEATECDSCGVVFADIRTKTGGDTANRDPLMRLKVGDHYVDLQCAWNDHGYRCHLKGCVSDSTTGSGPWYCSEHYWYGIKGWTKPAPRQYRQPGDDDEPVIA